MNKAMFVLFLLAPFLFLPGCNDLVDEGRIDFDLNGDGSSDVSYEYDEEGYYEFVDRNFDSRVDESHRYDNNDLIVKSKVDDDFDGVLETTVLYVNGSVSASFTDTDGDGVNDLRFKYQSGVLLYGEKYYYEEAGKFAQIGRVDYKFDYPVVSEKLTPTHMNLKEFHEGNDF